MSFSFNETTLFLRLFLLPLFAETLLDPIFDFSPSDFILFTFVSLVFAFNLSLLLILGSTVFIRNFLL
uniref:Uncharacterized protein n=1 Tax=Panstrongylus lignarius TaxID=156445 RepID=A0A224Y590_9HEMI